MVAEPEWERAVCSKAVAAEIAEPDDWFPEPFGLAQRRRAQYLCSICPLQEACLAYAKREDLVGIWGGEELGKRHSIYATDDLVAPPVSAYFTEQQRENFYEVHRLRADGLSRKEIGQQLNIHKSTVGRYLSENREVICQPKH